MKSAMTLNQKSLKMKLWKVLKKFSKKRGDQRKIYENLRLKVLNQTKIQTIRTLKKESMGRVIDKRSHI